MRDPLLFLWCAIRLPLWRSGSCGSANTLSGNGMAWDYFAILSTGLGGIFLCALVLAYMA
jgi:hypothetical protein